MFLNPVFNVLHPVEQIKVPFHVLLIEFQESAAQFGASSPRILPGGLLHQLSCVASVEYVSPSAHGRGLGGRVWFSFLVQDSFFDDLANMHQFIETAIGLDPESFYFGESYKCR